ncbi:hypothetical protein [Sphingobacterium psychroaquaticum]|uniref:hypothetical protein n=1 Tax=Sphingobacterium psychroaquaticum TaxID=561061 RepID=UPI001F10A549|nr:hypothetical protein [Sphingobacterium psychroaquaticum]
MKRFYRYFFLLLTLSGAMFTLRAQENTGAELTDDLQIDIKGTVWDAKSDTLTVDLFLISYQRQPREFKLNTYASQVIDSQGKATMYSVMKMGRVVVRLADRQNYIHYLLEEDTPVPLTIKIGNWGKRKAAKVLLVFEDSAEEGHFIQKEVNL